MPNPNILLVITDSVRARNTSLHGHRRETTPFLSKFSNTATYYEQAKAPSQWSLPSHTSLFTGFHVREHGVTSDGEGIKSGNTVFDDLQEEGYETGLFSENPYLTSLDTGLDSGFNTVEGGVREPPFDGVNPDEYKGDVGRFLLDAIRSGKPFRSVANGFTAKLAWDYPELIPAGFQRKLASGSTPGSMYTDLFCDWLDTTSGPWAACINYMDAHHPYIPQSEFNNWDDGTIAAVQKSIVSMPLGFYTKEDPWWKCELLELLYDGTIRQVDHEVERLIHYLRENDELDDTLVIITSDHGEGLAEISNMRGIRLAGHNVGEHEVNLHVPLLIKQPGQSNQKIESRPVTLTAIPEVIRNTAGGGNGQYELANRPVVATTQGLRAVQLDKLRKEEINVKPFEEQTDIYYEQGGEHVKKWMQWGSNRTSAMCVDAQTAYSVSDEESETVEEMVSGFKDAGIKRDVDKQDLDKATERRLENLGYR